MTSIAVSSVDFAPAFDDDAAVFAIERNDDALGADGCGQFFKKTRRWKRRPFPQ